MSIEFKDERDRRTPVIVPLGKGKIMAEDTAPVASSEATANALGTDGEKDISKTTRSVKVTAKKNQIYDGEMIMAGDPFWVTESEAGSLLENDLIEAKGKRK